uniref:MFS domain-containing protein n=2 Tax=Macrostomum lignano TaxID=282301 RepID=A0A1I8HEN3_9PLAT
MKFEEIVTLLGDFGLYQRLMYIIPCYAAICTAFNGIQLIYTLYVPDHRCRIPELGANDSWGIDASIVRQFVPTRPCAGAEEGDCFDRCRLFAANSTNETVTCSDGWVYDTSDMMSTFATENNFVCSRERQFLLTTVSQSYFYGLLVGSLVTGFISDKFGRRTTLFIYLAIQGLSNLISGLVSGVVEFWISRFVSGMASTGVFPTAFVIGIEFVGPSMRLHSGFIIEYTFTLGLLVTALLAFLLQNWRWISIASACISFASLPAAFFLPESPRWLLALGRHSEAELVIRKAAKVNGVQLPDELKLKLSDSDQSSDSPGSSKENCLSVFRYRRLVCLFANVIFQWLVVALVYQGLSLGAGSLPGSIFLTSSLNAVSEGCGYFMAHLLLRWRGRKAPHIFSMCLCGLVLIACIFPTVLGSDGLGGLLLTLALLGKVGVSASFGIIYLWTAEQVPTSMRQIVLGVAALASRVGSALGPLIVNLSDFVETSLGNALPLVLYGVCSLAAGLAASQMPETAGRTLPETLREGDELMKLQGLLEVKDDDAADAEYQQLTTLRSDK